MSIRKMRPGMTAVARIATNDVPNVMLVPSEAIFQRDGAPVVYKLDGSSSSKRQVEHPQARQGTGDRRSRRGAGRPDRDPTPAAGNDPEG